MNTGRRRTRAQFVRCRLGRHVHAGHALGVASLRTGRLGARGWVTSLPPCRRASCCDTVSARACQAVLHTPATLRAILHDPRIHASGTPANAQPYGDRITVRLAGAKRRLVQGVCRASARHAGLSRSQITCSQQPHGDRRHTAATASVAVRVRRGQPRAGATRRPRPRRYKIDLLGV